MVQKHLEKMLDVATYVAIALESTQDKECVYAHTTRKIICCHEKNRGINTKIVAINTCCHNFKIIASRGNK
jgi:hypothetical protein